MVISTLTEDRIAAAAALGAATMARIDRAHYARVLANLYEVVRWSVPFMETARARTTDPRLANYLEHHIEEELGHDQWLLDDMAALGAAREEPAPALVHAMATHARLLADGEVWALVGHMWALESRPPAPRALHGLRERLALTAEMTRTLDRHAEADPHHARELEVLVEGAAAEALAWIDVGARITSTAVIRMWLAIDEVDGGIHRAAAL